MLMVTPPAICSVMARLIALLIVATALTACASHVADYIPTWAGGPPKDLPPRPGTPEYDAYRQKMDDEVTRDARTRLSQKPILESLVCPNKRPLNDPGLPVIALLHKPSLTTVFNYSCGLAQCDWGPGPSLTCGQVRCHRNLQVLDAGQVLYDILAVGIPRIDAISEMGAIVYRHFCLPQSSSSSRLTAGASEFFILSQSGERPER